MLKLRITIFTDATAILFKNRIFFNKKIKTLDNTTNVVYNINIKRQMSYKEMR